MDRLGFFFSQSQGLFRREPPFPGNLFNGVEPSDVFESDLGALALLGPLSSGIVYLDKVSARMRHAPEIRFFEDTSVDDAFRLEEIFKEIHAEEEDDRDAAD